MKKIFRTFFAFLTLALGIEIVILICTKVSGWDNFELGRPFLAAVHVHLMVMGMLFFLIQLILEKTFNISSARFYNVFYILFLIGMSIVVSIMMYKGFVQIFGGTPIRGLIEGGAAIGHTTTFVGLFFFAACVYEKTVKAKKNTEEK